MEIEWVEPPQEAIFRHENKGGKYVEFALALQEHKGKWALLPEDPSNPRTKGSANNMAQNMRRGQVKGFTKGEYEAIADDSTGKALVHVRYVGPPETAPAKPAGKDEGGGDDAGGGGKKEPDRVRDPLGDDENEDDLVDPVEVRAWARDRSMAVSERGRIPSEVLQAYLADRVARRQAAAADLQDEVAS